MNKPTKDHLSWKVLVGVAIFFSCLTFTPLIMPANTFKPYLLGMPYTLWTGILLSVILVFLTYLATKIHPGKEN